MTTYFTSKAPSKSGRRAITSIKDLDIDLSTVNTSGELHKLPPKNVKAKQQLLAKYTADFHKWLLPLREGFSLLFYGFGSKKALLETFARDCLTDGGVVAFNGYMPSLNIREILLKVATLLRVSRGGNYKAIVEAVRGASPEARLYILIHNIDGPGLQSPEAQHLLSELARCPAICLLASVDHINAPLLWDRRTAARFNWLYFDVTTYAPYHAEAQEMPSLLIGRREAVRSSNAAVVLQTLVPQAREIFMLLAQAQLAPDANEEGCEGMTFGQLYRVSREQLLVANDTALRAHLTEFKDHDLLQTRRGQDGSDLLVIPIQAETLQQVLAELNDTA